jgi:hypothetical protein
MGKNDDNSKYVAAVGNNATVNIGAMGDNAKGKITITQKADPPADDVPGTGKHRKS